MPRRTISGLRVLVTGASSGIGRELALELARRGAGVIAMARRQERLNEVVEAARSTGGTLFSIVGDVTSPTCRLRALDLCKQELGGLDALVNNAGIGAVGPFDQADESRLRKVMEVNFHAPVEFIRASLPLLRQGTRPIIVNVSSVLGHRAVPLKSEYCASKFALHGFSDSLRAELWREKIDVLLVSPSTTQSEFFEHLIGDKAKSRGRLGAMTPAKVACRIVRGMRTGRHEMILPLGGRLLVWLDRLCPPLADRLVAWFQ